MAKKKTSKSQSEQESTNPEHSKEPQIKKYPRIKSQPKSENKQPGQWFPKYILDENRKETDFFTQQEIWRYSWLCNLMPAEVKKQDSCVSRHQIIWTPYDFGKACFKQKVKEILCKPDSYEYEDLKKLTTREIIALMDIQLNKAGNEAFRKNMTQWQTELREAYNIGLAHKEYWQKNVIEAIKSLRQWYDNFTKGNISARYPLPYMKDNSRLPDTEDLPWMYLVLGMKLQEIYSLKRVFIPENVEIEMVGLWNLLEKPVWGIVHGAGSLEDFKTWWGIVKRDIEKNRDTKYKSENNSMMQIGKNLFQTEKEYRERIESFPVFGQKNTFVRSILNESVTHRTDVIGILLKIFSPGRFIHLYWEHFGLPDLAKEFAELDIDNRIVTLKKTLTKDECNQVIHRVNEVLLAWQAWRKNAIQNGIEEVRKEKMDRDKKLTAWIDWICAHEGLKSQLDDIEIYEFREYLENIAVEIDKRESGINSLKSRAEISKDKPTDSGKDNNKEIKERFTFTESQAFFDKRDLNLPSGSEVKPVEVLKKLVDNFGEVVFYNKLEDTSKNEASEILRGKVSKINQAMKKAKVPCKIASVKWHGYVIKSQVHKS